MSLGIWGRGSPYHGGPHIALTPDVTLAGSVLLTRRTVNQRARVGMTSGVSRSRARGSQSEPVMATKEEESKSIFISYGRELDVSQFVKQLKRDLEANGYSVWLDLESIPSGSDWHGAIGTGLQECASIIPIITQKYIGSRFCMNELYTADGDKKLIFPIMYEDVDLSSSEAGRAVKFIISGINWTMFRPGKDDYVDSLQKLIKGMKEKG